MPRRDALGRRAHTVVRRSASRPGRPGDSDACRPPRPDAPVQSSSTPTPWSERAHFHVPNVAGAPPAASARHREQDALPTQRSRHALHPTQEACLHHCLIIKQASKCVRAARTRTDPGPRALSAAPAHAPEDIALGGAAAAAAANAAARAGREAAGWILARRLLLAPSRTASPGDCGTLHCRTRGRPGPAHPCRGARGHSCPGPGTWPPAALPSESPERQWTAVAAPADDGSNRIGSDSELA